MVFMFPLYLAHATDTHDNIVESTTHIFEVDTVFATIIAVLAGTLFVILTHLIFHKPSVTTAVSLACLFLIGVFTYSVAPVVSALCIVTGFIFSLAIVFLSIVKG